MPGLLGLFLDGGMTIETPPGRSEDEPIYLRTVIQPDGDVVTFLNGAYPSDLLAGQSGAEDLIAEHLARVRHEIATLGQEAKASLTLIAGLGSLGALFGAAIPNLERLLAQPEQIASLILEARTLASAALGMALGALLAEAARRLAAWWLKREIGKLLRSARGG